MPPLYDPAPGQRMYEAHVAQATVHKEPQHWPVYPSWKELTPLLKAHWAALEFGDPSHRYAAAEERKAFALESITEGNTGQRLGRLLEMLERQALEDEAKRGR